MSAATDNLERLRMAAWLHWPETQAVFEALSVDGHTVRAVGGAVRDTLLGRSVVDIDMATDAEPNVVAALAGRAGLRAIETGISHGTITVLVNSKPFEVTTLRADVETYGRHARVAFTQDWEADARRRDFTMNALYSDADGTLFDPLGGLSDLEEGRVRFIGDARTRIREDYLRILRFFRFCAELETNGVDMEGVTACVREHAGLAQLSRERVRGELCRLLVAPGAAVVLDVMFAHGLLVAVLGGAPMLARFRRFCAVEAEASGEPDAMLRLAALVVHVDEDVQRLTERFRLSRAESETLAAAARFRVFQPRPDEDAARALHYRLGTETYTNALMMAQAADDGDASHPEWRMLCDIAREAVPVFPLKGEDIVGLGVSAGPRVGEILRLVEDSWVEGGFSATPDALLETARNIADRFGEED